jgi:DDE family transposase
MSHQDQGRNCAVGSHAHELFKALQWLVPLACLKDLKFRKDCTWTVESLAFGAILWSWSDYRHLGERFQHARKIIKHLFGKQCKPAGSYQAFVKLLRKWTPALQERLASVFRQKMVGTLETVWEVAGWVVYAGDGSRAKVPRTRRNEACYSPNSKLSRAAQKRRRAKHCRQREKSLQQKANVPQIWLTVLWHVGSGLPWAWQAGPSDSSERAHLQALLATLPDNALVVADAGFVGYDLWRTILGSERHFVVRVGGNVKLLKKLGYARENQGTVYLWPDKAAARDQPPLVLRLIVVHNGRHPVYLVTNLPKAKLSDDQAIEIYARRWGIELFYRHCKQTFERAKLRSRDPDNAMVELHWSLLGMWAMGLHSHARLVPQGVAPQKISFANVLRAYRESMRYYRWQPEPSERLLRRLDLALIDDYVRRNKTSQDYPRKKQETAAGPPTIRLATRQQRRKANQIKDHQQIRLTA